MWSGLNAGLRTPRRSRPTAGSGWERRYRPVGYQGYALHSRRRQGVKVLNVAGLNFLVFIYLFMMVDLPDILLPEDQCLDMFDSESDISGDNSEDELVEVL